MGATQVRSTGLTDQRWRAHRVLGLGLRVAIALVPIVVGLAVGAALADWLRRPDGLAGTILWWGAVLSVTVLVVMVVERLARRLLPLSLLLRLTLLFPDRAPSRFHARHAGEHRAFGGSGPRRMRRLGQCRAQCRGGTRARGRPARP